MPSLLTKQLISGVESRRPKGPQPDDPILLQLEQPLLPVIACKMIKEGHLEVGNGDLHLISVVLPKVLRQTTVGPSAIPAIRFMVWPTHLEILVTPNIILRMGAGAEDVVDHVVGGAGGPLKQSVGLAIRPAGDGIGKLESTWLMKEASSWVAGKAATLHPLASNSERICGGNCFPQIAASPEGWDDGASWKDSQVLRVLVEDALQLLQALLDVRPPAPCSRPP